MPSGTSTAHTAAAAMRSGRSQRRWYCGSQRRMGSEGGSSRYQRTGRVAMPSPPRRQRSAVRGILRPAATLIGVRPLGRRIRSRRYDSASCLQNSPCMGGSPHGLSPAKADISRARQPATTGHHRPSRCHPAPARPIQAHGSGLQNGCRGGGWRGVWVEKSLQISGSEYGIRTRATAVRGRPKGLSERNQRGAPGHSKSQELWPFAAKTWSRFPQASQRRQSRTGHSGYRMIAAAGARHVMPGMQEEAAEKIDAGLSAALAR